MKWDVVLYRLCLKVVREEHNFNKEHFLNVMHAKLPA